jgi:hypothetical protein
MVSHGFLNERKAAAAQGSGAAPLHSIQHGVHGEAAKLVSGMDVS